VLQFSVRDPKNESTHGDYTNQCFVFFRSAPFYSLEKSVPAERGVPLHALRSEWGRGRLPRRRFPRRRPGFRGGVFRGAVPDDVADPAPRLRENDGYCTVEANQVGKRRGAQRVLGQQLGVSRTPPPAPTAAWTRRTSAATRCTMPWDANNNKSRRREWVGRRAWSSEGAEPGQARRSAESAIFST